MKTQNVDFREALELLAKQAGIALKRGPARDPSKSEAWKGAMNHAQAFFREAFGKSSAAKDYCERRGLDAKVLAEWELGYSPDVGDALATSLKKAGFSLAECRSLFLVEEDPSGGFFDKFRGRLMFAIRDERGELVGFGGRLLGDGHPKYINSSDTPLYRKSRVLYGMHAAKETLRKERRAILVEGYLDVIACHRAGLTSALASLGTSLTEEHAKLLARWVDEVVVFYDGDNAGRKASRRAIEVLQPAGLSVKIARLPQGQDPDTALKNLGAASLHEAIEQATTPVAFEIDTLIESGDPNEAPFWKEAVGLLSKSTSDIEIERFVFQLAPLYPGIRDINAAAAALRREIGRSRRNPGAAPISPRPTLSPEKIEAHPAEILLLRHLLSPDFAVEAYRALGAEDIAASAQGQLLVEAILKAFPESAPQGPPPTWLPEIESEEARETLATIPLLRSETPLSSEVLHDALVALLKKRDQRRLQKWKVEGAQEERIAHLTRIREAAAREST